MIIMIRIIPTKLTLAISIAKTITTTTRKNNNNSYVVGDIGFYNHRLFHSRVCSCERLVFFLLFALLYVTVFK